MGLAYLILPSELAIRPYFVGHSAQPRMTSGLRFLNLKSSKELDKRRPQFTTEFVTLFNGYVAYRKYPLENEYSPLQRT